MFPKWQAHAAMGGSVGKTVQLFLEFKGRVAITLSIWRSAKSATEAPPQPTDGTTTDQEAQELQRFPDYPGWLWNPSTEEWVEDPDYENPEQ